ncbi:MAG TPA: alpha/beta fold hydrolase [Pyrinomonadaceae bacterium]|nr:alpha/beta fold hydrolase [Pyrinomonadaceae bacterium]
MSTNPNSLTHLVRQPVRRDQSSPPLLLLLHGVGSNEHDLFGLAPYLDERFLIVSVRAPVVMGAGAYGWFNIEFTPQGMSADIEQAKRSLELLPGFIDEIVKTHGADDKCVYVAGFSQGAMMSLALALTRPEKMAGVVAMSGRFPSLALGHDPDRKSLAGLPVLVTHGLYDPVLPVEEGRAIQKHLQTLPVELTYREYPMGHEVILESLRDVSAWLSSTLDLRRAT